MRIKANVLLLIVLVSLGLLGVCQGGPLRKRFYRRTCPRAEDIVREMTWEAVPKRPELPAKFLRMHFHDCFVRGCDASILLNSTENEVSEKDTIVNSFLSGFDVIEDIKAALETECPGVVSCADILTLATRDAVSFQFQKPMWKVLLGRRDGRVSRASEVFAHIPGPFDNFTTLRQSFRNKGLNMHDLVVLSGAHTVGLGHCNFFSNRLFNFTGRGDQDPSLDPTYAEFLKTKCRGLSDTTTVVELDPGSGLKFDSNYYVALTRNKGLFQSDAALLTHKGARKIVFELRQEDDFFTEFSQSMRRMGAIEVLTGDQGEIRKVCGAVNS